MLGCRGFDDLSSSGASYWLRWVWWPVWATARESSLRPPLLPLETHDCKRHGRVRVLFGVPRLRTSTTERARVPHPPAGPRPSPGPPRPPRSHRPWGSRVETPSSGRPAAHPFAHRSTPAVRAARGERRRRSPPTGPGRGGAGAAAAAGGRPRRARGGAARRASRGCGAAGPGRRRGGSTPTATRSARASSVASGLSRPSARGASRGGGGTPRRTRRPRAARCTGSTAAAAAGRRGAARGAPTGAGPTGAGPTGARSVPSRWAPRRRRCLGPRARRRVEAQGRGERAIGRAGERRDLRPLRRPARRKIHLLTAGTAPTGIFRFIPTKGRGARHRCGTSPAPSPPLPARPAHGRNLALLHLPRRSKREGAKRLPE